MAHPLLSLMLLLLTILVGPLAAAADDRLIFVLAGQSNMAGRGGVSGGKWDGVVPPECAPSPSILRLSANLQWETAHDPLHADIDVNNPCGVGPGMPFARALLGSSAAPATTSIGLVPCAISASKIAQWGKGTELYETMLRRTREAVSSSGGKVAAVLWYQGSADTIFLTDAEAYGTRLEAFIRDVRQDLGMPDLPFITVAIAAGMGIYTDIVRNAQKGLALPHVTCIDSKGLELGADHLHFTTSAQVSLGKMFAEAYLAHASAQHQIGK